MRAPRKRGLLFDVRGSADSEAAIVLPILIFVFGASIFWAKRGAYSVDAAREARREGWHAVTSGCADDADTELLGRVNGGMQSFVETKAPIVGRHYGEIRTGSRSSTAERSVSRPDLSRTSRAPLKSASLIDTQISHTKSSAASLTGITRRPRRKKRLPSMMHCSLVSFARATNSLSGISNHTAGAGLPKHIGNSR